MEIIDAHTHCYPPEVTADPRTWAEGKNELHWASLVAPENRPSIQGWATRDEMLRDMDAAGVSKAVLMAWYWEHESTCLWHNQIIAEWVHSAPDRFIGFAAISPACSGARVEQQLKFAAELGLSGVGELHSGIQRFNSLTPGWLSLADWCTENKWPICLHVTESVGHSLELGCETPLPNFVRMAEQHPSLKMILAHWGGGLPFFELNPKVAPKLKNVYYDTAASPLLYEPRTARIMLDLLGPQKILYGSDYPLRTYPRTQKSPNFSQYLEELSGHLDSKSREAVLGGNFNQLLADHKTPTGSG